MAFLYHARPARMRGETLYPLNRLRETFPDLYEDERRKYSEREALLELRIPLLDVLWNNALHLAPIHPRHLAAAWRPAGLSSPAWEREFFEIPVERVDAHRAVWFESGALPLDDAARFDAKAYRELAEPPSGYLEYLQGARPSPAPVRARPARAGGGADRRRRVAPSASRLRSGPVAYVGAPGPR